MWADLNIGIDMHMGIDRYGCFYLKDISLPSL